MSLNFDLPNYQKKNLEFVEYMLHDSPYQNQQNDLDL